MDKYISKYRKSIVSGLIIWFILSAGLAGAQTSASAGILTLNLQPTLDRDGVIKATSITKAEMSNPDGTFVMKTATITGGTARFDLSGVAAGDYFIRVNDLADDLIPTRIDDPAKDISQSVGKKLRDSVIGNLSDPAYRIVTFSKGQGKRPVVSFSDGSNLEPERYAYVLLSLKTTPQKLEVRILGSTRVIPTASEINSFTPRASTHPSTPTSTNPQFSTWVFGESNHASDYSGKDTKCNLCHINMDVKPATFREVTMSNGWCFRCHYGKGGADEGFIDTTALAVTPAPAVTSTATATEAKPAEKQKTPAFEALSGVAALLAVLIIKRR